MSLADVKTSNRMLYFQTSCLISGNNSVDVDEAI